MTDLFGNMWSSQVGPTKIEHGPDKGNYTRVFLLWCEKTKDLKKEDFTTAFSKMEMEKAQRKRDGEEEMWPPDYASFIGYTLKAHGEIAHKYFPKLALPDKTAQERAKAAGEKEMRKLRSLFD